MFAVFTTKEAAHSSTTGCGRPARIGGHDTTQQPPTDKSWRDGAKTAQGTGLGLQHAALAWSFAKLPVFAPSPPAPRLPGVIQRKLAVSKPGDAYEHEADAVAEQVMRMPAGARPENPGRGDTDAAYSPGHHPGHVRPALRRLEVSGAHSDAAELPASVHEVVSTPGQALDRESRAFMEPRFGHSFDRVRVHAGPRAAESARAVAAKAYALGSHIVLGEGHNDVGSGAGRKLLAHELAHVVQQGNGSPGDLRRSPLLQRQPTSGIPATRSTETQLETRSIEIFRDAVRAYLASKNKPVTPKMLGLLRGEVTVSVLEGVQDGRIVTRVSINNSKWEEFVKGVLRPGEQYVERDPSTQAHAEIAGARKAAADGMRDALVGTSNKGCPHCVRQIDAEFPELAHVNPKIASRGSVQPTGRVRRPVTTTQVDLAAGEKYRGGRTPPPHLRTSVATSGEINTQNSPGTTGTVDPEPSVIIDHAQLHSTNTAPEPHVASPDEIHVGTRPSVPEPTRGAGGGFGALNKLMNLLWVIDILKIILSSGTPEEKAVQVGKTVAVGTLSGYALKTLLGADFAELAGPIGALLAIASMRSDNAQYNAEQELNEYIDKLTGEAVEGDNASWDTHPGSGFRSRAQLRQQVIDRLVAEQEQRMERLREEAAEKEARRIDAMQPDPPGAAEILGDSFDFK